MAQYIGNSLDTTFLKTKRQTYTYTAAGGQTVFQGDDSYGNSFVSISQGQTLVYENGVLKEPHSYTVYADRIEYTSGGAASGATVVIMTEVESALVSSFTRGETVALLGQTSIGVFNDINITDVPPASGQTLIWDGAQFIPSSAAFDGEGFDAAFALKSTSDLSEGSNLYYTNARVQTYLTDNSYATETYVGEQISSLVDSAPGVLDTLNELATALGDDPNFATTVTNALAAKYDSADFNADFSTRFATKSTTDLSEGTNKYYTDGRVDDRIALASVGDLSDVDITSTTPTNGQALIWDNDNQVFVPGDSFSQSDFDTAFGSKTTDNLSQGAVNLYYTEAKVNANFALKTTSDLAEGTNLYYTEGRVDANIASKTTDDLTEGNNFYYTDTRVATYLVTSNYATQTFVNSAISTASSNYATAAQGALADSALQSADLTGYVTETYVNTAVSNLVDASPETLDTLNELAAALGDDPNFATTISNSIGLKANTADLGTAAAQDVSYFATAAQGTLADSSLQSSDLTGYATETFVGTAISTASSDYATAAQGALADSALQSVTFSDLGITDGTVGQVLTTDGSGTYTFEDAAIGGAIVSGTAPVSPEQGALWFDNTNTGQLYTYVGSSWLSTAGISTLEFSSVGDLGDVDLVSNVPTAGQALVWDNVNSKFIPGDVAVDLTGYATETFVGTAISTASSDYATAAQGALADSALQSVAFADLTSTPTTLAGYGITDAFDGAYGSLSDTPTLGTASAQDVGYFATSAQGALADSAIQSLAGYATETYVGQQFDLLIDSAPGALDTLNELAAALGDDANFSTTITNSIALKANTADLGTAAAQDVEYFASAAQGTLADSALQSVAFADLTATPTTLAGYGITDAATSAQGALADSAIQSLAGYATETFVGSAITTASTDYATAAQGALADSALQSVAFADLTSTPTTLAGYGITDSFFDGAYGSLSGTPTLGTASAQDVGYFATAAQGALADSALQSADLTGYATETFVTNAIATKDNTDEITEGSTNLYYTDARVETKVDAYVTGGTGVTVTSGSIAIGQSVATSANVTFNDVTATGDLVVDGDLTVNGTTTSINVSQLEVTDNIIHVAAGNESSDLVDFGWVGHFYDGVASSHAGVVRDATDSKFKIVGAYTKDELTGTTVDFAHAGTSLGILVADTFEGNLTGNVTGTVSSLSNLSTSDLSEGTNEYYTDAKVGTYLTTNAYATETFVGSAITTASSNYATSAQGALADSALQSVAFADLTSTPTTLAGYGITDAFDGAYGSLTGVPTLGTASAQDVGYFATAAQGTLADSALQSADLIGYATETFVNTAVSNLVDAAPGTLDTLNELAAALGDDANFSTTVTNSIALKANSADLGTASAQDVGYFATAAQGALADTALQSVAFTDLTSTPTTLAGYGITDAFDGAYGSLSGTPTIPSSLTDLGITDGTVGQVLVTDGAGVYTFEDASASGATVSGTAPVAPEQGALWFDNTNTGQLYTYVGASWLSTAGISTLEFSSVGDLGDVDLVTNAPTDGQSLVWDNATSKFVPGTVSTDLTGYATETFVGTAISTASSNYATAAQGSLADSALQSVAFTDLTSTPTTLAGYGITDAATTAQGALADTALQSADLTGYATETYVNTAVSNLVDAAPGTLDTLNELAAALGDDANFATTTANAIGLKANSADLGTAAAQDVGYFATAAQGALADSALQSADLTGYATETFVSTAISTASSDYATSAQGALADSALQSVTFTDLTTTPTTLAGYGITDAFDGAYGSLSGAPTLGTASAQDVGYFATAAQGALADSSIQSLAGYATETYVNTAVSNLVDAAPGTLDTLNELAAALGDDANFATTTANSIALKANSADLGTASVQDVGYFATAAQGALADSALQSVAFADLGITDGTVGQVLTTDGAGSFTFADAGGSGGSGVTVSGTAPSSPSDGDLWFDDTTTGEMYVYENGSWTSTGISATLGSVGDLLDVDITTTAPTDGQSLVWDNANSKFVPGDVAGGGGGSSITTSETAPVSPTAGDMWFNSATLALYLYYADGDSTQWIQINDAGGAAGNGLVLISSTPPANPASGDLWYDDGSTGSLLIYNGSVWVSTADGGGGGGQSTYWVEASTTYDAVAGSKLFVDTSSSAVQVNLPASPSMGDEVYVVDAAGNSGTYNITVNRNGKKITGLDEDFTIDVNGAAIILAYYNATRGWIVISK